MKVFSIIFVLLNGVLTSVNSIALAQTNISCTVNNGIETVSGNSFYYTRIICNSPATLPFSSMAQGSLVSSGVIKKFKNIKQFSQTCVYKLECSKVIPIGNTKTGRYRVATIITFSGKDTESISPYVYLNTKGNTYPVVKSTRTFNWGYTQIPKNIKSEVNKYVPFPEGKRFLKQVINRKGDPLYGCLQFMWKDRLIKFYNKNKFAIPNSNEAHHIFPVEYGGLDAFGSSIIPSSNLPKLPIVGKAKIDECFDSIKVGEYDLDNGVLLSKKDHSKFTNWWASF